MKGYDRRALSRGRGGTTARTTGKPNARKDHSQTHTAALHHMASSYNILGVICTEKVMHRYLGPDNEPRVLLMRLPWVVVALRRSC